MKKKPIVISLCIGAVLLLGIGIFRYFHPTHSKFNDRRILAHTEEQIVEKYGEFSKAFYSADGTLLRGVYQIRDDTPELIMGYDDSLWYEIYFEDGIAVNVRLQEGWYGG